LAARKRCNQLVNKMNKELSMTQSLPPSNRYADLDWLRIGAFVLLILYHTGMYYVTDWGWHLKSPHQFDILQPFMKLLNPWRMSLLFLLGGMALALAQPKFGSLPLMRRRLSRLGIPLLFGMFVVVAPQVYFEARDQKLIEAGFWQFWLQYINPNTALLKDQHSPIGLLTWNHLWFLPYLLCYSLLVLPLHRLLQKAAQASANIPLWVLAIVLVALLLCANLTLREQYPSTHALTDDWYNHARYSLAFITGYLLVLHPHWWARLPAWRYGLLLTALVCSLLRTIDHYGGFNAFASANPDSWWLATFWLVSPLNVWAWLGTLLAFAAVYLRRPAFDRQGVVRRYASAAVLPWYILHQTITVVLAAWLAPLELATGLEAGLLIGGTVLGCALGYELCRRVALLNWLTGGQLTSAKPARLSYS